MTIPRLSAGLLLIAGLAVTFAPKDAEAERRGKESQMLLIGIDGAEWMVIEDLWAKGYLPNLRALVNRGVRAKLKTEYGKSPVIWTTIATGVLPEKHGITGFVVATDEGDVPVASTVRKVPALWNIATSAGLYVNQVGWWGSWPAEVISGVNVTDKVQAGDVNVVQPKTWETKIKGELAQINSQTYKSMFPGEQQFAPEDRVVAHVAPTLAASGYDLMVMYLHGSDPNSHRYWRYYRPQDFPGVAVDAAEAAKHADRIPKAYKSIDQVIGRMVESSGTDTNIIIVSDHGFHALDEPIVKVVIDLDLVLAKLGYQVRSGEKIDVAKSKASAYGSRHNEVRKRVRFYVAGRDAGGTVAAADVAKHRAELEKALLTKVTYASGMPVFGVEDALPADKAQGADFVVVVLDDGATKELIINGAPTTEPVKGMVENSGGHEGNPPGIFIAAGPDINTKAVMPATLSIHDVAPTVLYGMGLPVGQDFSGKAQTALYTDAYRQAHPLKTVPSYGTTRSSSEVSKSKDDAEMLKQLQELGYLE
ncbi:MAG: hypothetical protein RIT28_2794 [Pseudomonadota bacterium]